MIDFIKNLFRPKSPFIPLSKHKPLLGQMVVFVSITQGYVTDPWAGWMERDGSFARWPHPFPPTHWLDIPSAHAWKSTILAEK